MNKLFESILGNSLTFVNVLIVLASAAVLGFVISLCFYITHKKSGFHNSLLGAIIILPVVFSSILMLVGSDIARAFSVAGAFALIRFRSAPGDVKDLTYLFGALAVGLACGEGCIGYAVVITIVFCIVMFAVELSGFGKQKPSEMALRITMPENINFENAYEGILREYTVSHKIERVRTTDYGALFEINYTIIFKNNVSKKEFIDALRTRNGNMPISLSVKLEPDVLGF